MSENKVQNSTTTVKKIASSLIIILFPCISYLLLGPVEIYSGNTQEFFFTLKDFIGYFLLATLIICLLYALITAFLPHALSKLIHTIVFAFALLSYLQYSFLNRQLTNPNGTPMNWDEVGSYRIINLVIWIAGFLIILVLSFVCRKYWKKIMLSFSAFFSCIQLVAVITLLISCLGSESKESIQMLGNDQFKVAKEENIIVYIMDTCGTGYIENALEKYPQLLDCMKDFTYYNNADCNYYCTYPSVSHFLTEQPFDFTMTSDEWLAEAWDSDQSHAFYTALHNAGYDCELYSRETGYVFGSVNNIAYAFDNVGPETVIVNTKSLLKQLGKYSAYRYLPYVLKPYFEVLTTDFMRPISFANSVLTIEDNVEFHEQLDLQGLSYLDSNKGFIIEHIMGMHDFDIDENGNASDTATANQTMAGNMTMFNEYMDELKRLGVYDSSTIILMADHGSGAIGNLQPIFFIKLAGEQHDNYQVNSAPVSYEDFQATILSIIGEDYSDYGTSIWDWSEGDQRERTLYTRELDDTIPSTAGMAYNAYYKYTYYTDSEELDRKAEEGPDEIIPAKE